MKKLFKKNCEKNSQVKTKLWKNILYLPIAVKKMRSKILCLIVRKRLKILDLNKNLDKFGREKFIMLRNG